MKRLAISLLCLPLLGGCLLDEHVESSSGSQAQDNFITFYSYYATKSILPNGEYCIFVRLPSGKTIIDDIYTSENVSQSGLEYTWPQESSGEYIDVNIYAYSTNSTQEVEFTPQESIFLRYNSSLQQNEPLYIATPQVGCRDDYYDGQIPLIFNQVLSAVTISVEIDDSYPSEFYLEDGFSVELNVANCVAEFHYNEELCIVEASASGESDTYMCESSQLPITLYVTPQSTKGCSIILRAVNIPYAQTTDATIVYDDISQLGFDNFLLEGQHNIAITLDKTSLDTNGKQILPTPITFNATVVDWAEW